MTLEQTKFATVTICASIVIAMLAVIWWHMGLSRQQILEQNALVAAESYAATFQSLRTFYTAEVVSRVPRDHVIITHDYKRRKNAIPLPATLTIRLAEEIGRQTDGFSVNLYSKYPFPWRRKLTQLDEFENRALEGLSADPGQPYYEFQQALDGRYLRYAVADLMRPECVACHNSHPDSPKTDWKAGDLRGVLAIAIPMHEKNAAIEDTFRYLLFYFIAGGVVLIGTVIWALGKVRT